MAYNWLTTTICMPGCSTCLKWPGISSNRLRSACSNYFKHGLAQASTHQAAGFDLLLIGSDIFAVSPELVYQLLDLTPTACQSLDSFEVAGCLHISCKALSNFRRHKLSRARCNLFWLVPVKTLAAAAAAGVCLAPAMQCAAIVVLQAAFCAYTTTLPSPLQNSPSLHPHSALSAQARHYPPPLAAPSLPSQPCLPPLLTPSPPLPPTTTTTLLHLPPHHLYT